MELKQSYLQRESIVSEINDCDNQISELKQNESNCYSNRVNKLIYGAICVLSVILYIAVIIIFMNNGNMDALLLLFPITFVYVVILSKIYNHCHSKTNKLCKKINNQKINLHKELYDLDIKLHQLAKQYLYNKYGVTEAQLDYDLTGIIHKYNYLKDSWYTSEEQLEVIDKALARKYKKQSNEDITSDLQLENLVLKNKSIAIDNDQKKFWKCDYCENVNHGTDMKCINCGAVRTV